MNFKIFFVVAAATVLSACGGGHDGGEFVGKWQNIDREKVTEVIERNGDQFIIAESSPSLYEANKIQTTRTSATINPNGNLVVSTGFGVAEFAIDKKTGNLISSGAAFKRVE